MLHAIVLAFLLSAQVDRDVDCARLIGAEAFESAHDPFALAEKLLAEPDETLQSLAFTYLLNNDGWTSRETLRLQLLRILADDAMDDETRASVIWVFGLKGDRDAVRDLAYDLARDHSRPSLAHRVAAALVHVEDEPEAMARFLASESRAIREEALHHLTGCENRPAAALLAIATDATEPAWVRGEAIEGLGPCAADPATRDALLQLLDRKHWFFGAQGQHFLIHSLARVIPSLAETDRARLEALREEIKTLPADQREYVEWVLNYSLAR